MAPVIWLPVTVASVVATLVIRFGNATCAQLLSCSRPPARDRPGSSPPAGRDAGRPGRQLQGGGSSQVSETCSLQPSQNSSRLTPHRASVSYGEAIRI